MFLLWCAIGAFFVAWAGWVVFAKRRGWSVTVAVGGGFIVACLTPIFLSFPIYIYEQVKLKNVDSVDSAKEFFIGTWVYSEPLTGENKMPWWERLEIMRDGTVKVQVASPRDTKWGQPEIQTYKVFTDKFSDTGERYYGIRMSNSSFVYIVRDADVVAQSSLSPYVAVFHRGDKNLSN